MTAVVAVVAFVAAYVLIATERVHRVAAALGGAAVMLAIGATDAEHAFFSEESGVDWNVVFLLLGMMVIVGVIKQTGAFEYLAIWAAKKAKGRPFRIMVMLVLITALASALLDNVTTVLLVVPVTVLGVHQVRTRGRRGHRCALRAVPVAALLRLRVRPLLGYRRPRGRVRTSRCRARN